jgi:hypothetical protein
VRPSLPLKRLVEHLSNILGLLGSISFPLGVSLSASRLRSPALSSREDCTGLSLEWRVSIRSFEPARVRFTFVCVDELFFDELLCVFEAALLAPEDCEFPDTPPDEPEEPCELEEPAMSLSPFKTKMQLLSRHLERVFLQTSRS